MDVLKMLLLNIAVSGGQSISAPGATVDPVITTTAVIGTEITGDDGTWTPTPDSYTYQWQRLVVATWGDIAGATNKNYTPVKVVIAPDTGQDFGLALRLEVTATNAAGSTVAYSNQTALTAEAPAQTVGPAELLANAGFTAWTGDNPDNWAVSGESGSDPEVTERDSNQGHAASKTTGGAVNLYNSATALQPVLSQTVLGTGSYHESIINVSNLVAGSLYTHGIQGAPTQLSTTTGLKRMLSRATGAIYQIRAVSAGADVTVDSASAKAITLNGQLVAPSANMRLDLHYTLPVSPVAGSQIWLLPRVSDFSLGNNWNALLIYTGAQWDINLYSVATFTRTSRISAANVGTTVGDRVNMNADSISLYTTANGTDYTQQGLTISNSTYQTATGVNALWTSDVTPGTMVYASAS